MEVDNDSFVTISKNRYGKNNSLEFQIIMDKDYLYTINGDFLLTTHDYIDINSFEFVDVQSKNDTTIMIYQDKDNLYFDYNGELKILPGVDIESFQQHVLHGAVYPEIYYYSDAEHIYYIDRNRWLVLLEGADPSTFEEIEYGYFKDKNAVYRDFKKIEQADPESFIVGGLIVRDEDTLFRYSEDKERYYFAHPSHYDLINSGFSGSSEVEIIEMSKYNNTGKVKVNGKIYTFHPDSNTPFRLLEER